MKEELEKYVNLLFAGNPEAEEIRQEILLNTLDRYDDLIAQGKNPQAAYSLAIAGIGDVSELIGKPQEAEEPVREKPQVNPEGRKKGISLGSAVWLAGTVIYFVISFFTNAWFITWLIFPLCGAVHGLIRACFDLKEAKKHEE